MNSLNFLRIACIAVLGVGLCACPPVTSKTPVGTTVKAVPDPVLTGVWRGRFDKDTPSYLTFLPRDDGTISVVWVTPPSKGDAGGYGVFTMQAVTLGKYHYLNVRETLDDGKPATGPMADRTFPVLYRFDDDGALVMYIIDENVAKNAVKAGKIAGTIASGDYGDVVLTATPGELDAFMASPAGRALFTKPAMVLRKVK